MFAVVFAFFAEAGRHVVEDVVRDVVGDKANGDCQSRRSSSSSLMSPISSICIFDGCGFFDCFDCARKLKLNDSSSELSHKSIISRVTNLLLIFFRLP